MSYAQRPVEVFLSYAPEDEEFRLKLENHLKLLEREGFIILWHKRRIVPGTDWGEELDRHLNKAAVIFLLISDDFLASDYCYGTEMRRAMERHEAGDARVIPIILRPVEWQSAPFGKLPALPSNGNPITKWQQSDDAYLDIAQGLKKVIQEMQGNIEGITRRKWITSMIVAGVTGVIAGAGGTLVYSSLMIPNALSEVNIIFVNGVLPTTFNPNSLKPALEKMLGSPSIRVHLELSKTYEDAIERFVSKEFNVLWASDLAYVVIGKRLRDLGQPIPIPILQINNPAPAEKLNYYSYILTKRSSKINTIADLKGKTLAVVDKYSTSGYLCPLYEIYRKGLTVNDFQLKPAGDHLASLDLLLSDSVDACAVSSRYYKNPDSTHPDKTYVSSVYTKLLNKYQFPDNDIISIARVGPLPTPPIAVQDDLSDSDRWRLRQAFLLIDDATMSALDVSGFSLVTDSAYDVIRTTARDARKLGVDVDEV